MTLNTENRIWLLGCPIDNISLKEAIATIEDSINSRRPHQYIAINANKIVKLQKDARIREILLKSDLNIIDGQPLIWVSKLLGRPVKERFGGLDIMAAIIPIAAEKGYRVYFLGSKNNVVVSVVDKYKKLYPGLKITGWRHGYWTKQQEKEIVEKIKESNSDLLFLAISSPKKEIFLNNNLYQMNIPFVIGVGGAFDILAGNLKRAPKFVQDIGLEWLFRVIQEPRRLWKRYLFINTIFIYLVLRELLKIR